MSNDNNPPVEKKSSSPLKWIGCGCLLALIILVGGCGSMVVGVFMMIRSAEPCQQAFAAAAADAQVIAICGEPLEMGYLVSGNISLENSSGSADISIPVSGPKDSGTIEVQASRSMSRWTYQAVVFVSASGQRITITIPGE